MRTLVALILATTMYAQTARDLKVERASPPLPGNRARWAVVVGVSSYKYAPPHAQLKFAHRDAQEFARFLMSAEGGGFPSSNVRLLTEESATVGGVRAALHSWLPRATGPNDIVYLFFAGHAVAAERGESYFVAHDSDPQNLHATGISFREVNATLTSKLRASTVVLFADACHAGGIGWTSDPTVPSRAQASLEALGAKDRAFIKLLASRPSEQSFEDERWGGGHGVFTYSVLTALRGAAERERDGFVRVSELIDYVSRVVPEQTGTKQNPRIAGNFEGSLPMASLPAELRREPVPPATLRLTGPAGAVIYLDRQFRGAIRPTGDLVIETVSGAHTVAVDLPGSEAFDQPVTLRAGQNMLDLQKSQEFALLRLRSAIRAGRLLGSGGAWEQFKSATFPEAQAAAAEALIMGALEDVGMECVSDYVQSTTNTLKRPMFLQAVEAFTHLRTLRPADSSLEAKALFCQGRAQIAAGDFAPAVESLKRSLAIDSEFACSYNALGVALGRLNRGQEARAAFEQAARLTPAWALPPLQIAQQMIGANDLKGAVPHLESAAKLNPKAVGILWALARVHRQLGNAEGFARAANATVALNPNYAPIYVEMAQFYEAIRDNAKAAQAYDTYLLLAPNYADSTEVRKRAQAVRAPVVTRPKTPPSLRRNRN
jgi:uncharacterized caspase-like protein/Flp pilus assembly protein TadD